MAIEFGINHKGVDYWLKVTGYQYSPPQQLTFDQEGFEEEIEVWGGEAYIDADKLTKPSHLKSRKGLFDIIWHANEAECLERALEEYLEDQQDYRY